MLFYFIIIILLPTLIITLLINVTFFSSMQKSANTEAAAAISQANRGVDSSIRNVENMIDMLCDNKYVTQFMTTPGGSENEYASIEKDLSDLLQEYSKYYYDVEGIALINNNDEVFSNEMNKTDSLITTKGWYTQTISQANTLQIFGHLIDRGLEYTKNISSDDIISLAKPVADKSTGKVLGVILVDIQIRTIENVLSDILIGKGGFAYIIDSENNIIFAPVNPVIPRIDNHWFKDGRSFNRQILNTQYQFVTSSSFYTKWRTIGVFSLTEIMSDMFVLRQTAFIILIIFVIIAFALSNFFSNSIAKPIISLTSLMNQAEKGNLDISFPVKHNDEIGMLGKQFNSMISKIKQLIETVYHEQKQKREAELSALQSQIKPHFLYNTLDTLHWMGKKHGAEDMNRIIMSLTKLFRIGLSRGKEIIPLQDEIEHVKSYLTIQQSRYEDVLNYEIQYDTSLGDCLVQKLILQPLVENSIYHGIKPKKEPCTIRIDVYQENEILHLDVLDDGIGMTPEKVEELNSAFESVDHTNQNNLGYGIFNVHERIRLSYGNEYGLKIERMETGALVKITHPLIYPETKG